MRQKIIKNVDCTYHIYNFIYRSLMRRFVELTFLLGAIGSLFTLVYIHVAFSQTPASCLNGIEDAWPRDGVLRVEIQPAQMLAGRELLAFDDVQLEPFG